MTLEELQKERESLIKQFEEMKSRANQVAGAVQLLDQLIARMTQPEPLKEHTNGA